MLCHCRIRNCKSEFSNGFRNQRSCDCVLIFDRNERDPSICDSLQRVKQTLSKIIERINFVSHTHIKM